MVPSHRLVINSYQLSFFILWKTLSCPLSDRSLPSCQRNTIYTDIDPADSVRLASWKKQLGDIQVKNNNQFRLVEISISLSQDQVGITAQDLSLIG